MSPKNVMPGISGDLGAREIVRMLEMQPHPEGGWYRRTYEDPAQQDGRPLSTAIYYLLEAEQMSAWHRVDAVEIWHYHAGAPISLTLSPPDGRGRPPTYWVLIFGRDAGPRSSCRPCGGRQRSVWGPGPWSAAPSHRGSGSKVLSWLHPIGDPVRPDFAGLGNQVSSVFLHDLCQ